MKAGHVIMQYKKLLGYAKGPDDQPEIIPEQAKTVRMIYERYLAGDTLRTIKESLEAQGALTATGNTEWMISNLKSILTNEKYCGDTLLQKTFIANCISKKIIPNTGQLPWRWCGEEPRREARREAPQPGGRNTAGNMPSVICCSAANAEPPTAVAFGRSMGRKGSSGDA